MTPSRRIALPLRTLTAALALGLAGTAAAGVSYRLDRPSAAPGDTVTIEAVYFNEGNARATWEAPPALVLQWRGAYLLQQRPEPGIWGGLWSLPEFDVAGDPGAASRALGLEPERHSALAAFSHTFTHYRLHVRPWWVEVRAASLRDGHPPTRWVAPDDLAATALPAPVKKLLLGLAQANAAHGTLF